MTTIAFGSHAVNPIAWPFWPISKISDAKEVLTSIKIFNVNFKYLHSSLVHSLPAPNVDGSASSNWSCHSSSPAGRWPSPRWWRAQPPKPGSRLSDHPSTYLSMWCLWTREGLLLMGTLLKIVKHVAKLLSLILRTLRVHCTIMIKMIICITLNTIGMFTHQFLTYK